MAYDIPQAWCDQYAENALTRIDELYYSLGGPGGDLESFRNRMALGMLMAPLVEAEQRIKGYRWDYADRLDLDKK